MPRPFYSPVNHTFGRVNTPQEKERARNQCSPWGSITTCQPPNRCCHLYASKRDQCRSRVLPRPSASGPVGAPALHAPSPAIALLRTQTPSAPTSHRLLGGEGTTSNQDAHIWKETPETTPPSVDTSISHHTTARALKAADTHLRRFGEGSY